MSIISNLAAVGALIGAIRIAAAHNLSVHQALSRDRHPKLVRARRHILVVTKWSLGLSLPEAGRIFGLDHSTVLYHERRYQQLLEADHG